MKPSPAPFILGAVHSAPLIEPNTLPPRDPECVGYHRLAIGLITRALRDFGGLDTDDDSIDVLGRIRRQIDAGAFLFERTDALIPFWFHWAGIDPAAVRATTHVTIRGRGSVEWRPRLVELRAREREMVRQMNANQKWEALRRGA